MPSFSDKLVEYREYDKDQGIRRRGISVRPSKRFVSGICCLLIGTVMASAADPEKSLRETVQRFYQAALEAQWKTAEQYVDSQSRDLFRANPPGRFHKFEVRKVEFLKDKREALVTVGVDMPVAQIGGTVMTLNAQTVWRESKGKWYMLVNPAPPMPVVKGITSAAVAKQVQLNELRFDYTEFDFGWKRQGDRVAIEFPFVNVSDHAVRVFASLVTTCNCITVSVSKETVAPGEKASVLFTLEDSTPFTFYYHQGIGVRVEPGDGSAILDIVGFLAPASENPPESAAPSNP